MTLISPIPVANVLSRLTSGYGPRINPVTKEYQSLHNGLDLAFPEGTPIVAVADGIVVSEWTASTGGGDGRGTPHAVTGNALKIDHGDGLATGYLHLSRKDVHLGDRVKQGQQIGLLGTTGRSTGPHLHFIVYQNGKEVDPKPLIAWEITKKIASTVGSVWLWWLVAGGITGGALWLAGKRGIGPLAKRRNPHPDEGERFISYEEQERRAATQAARDKRQAKRKAREAEAARDLEMRNEEMRIAEARKKAARSRPPKPVYTKEYLAAKGMKRRNPRKK